MRLSFLVLGLVLVGCTGSDPIAKSTSRDAGTPGTPGILDAGTSDAGTSRVYGAFLSSRKLGVDFASASTPDGALVIADGICSSLARDAGLENAERYEALLTVHGGGSTEDLGRFLSLRTVDVDTASWCAVAPSSPPRPKCGLGTIFFASPDDFETGPVDPLLSDEHGKPSAVQSYFLSGFVLEQGKTSSTQGGLRNCNGWSHTIVYDSSKPPPPVEDAFGFGNAAPRPADDRVAYRWVGDTGAFCEGRFQFPLLCIEHP